MEINKPKPYYPERKKRNIYIKGKSKHEYGRKIIRYLENLGGINTDELCGCPLLEDMYYFIDKTGKISGSYNIPEGYKEIRL